MTQPQHAQRLGNLSGEIFGKPENPARSGSHIFAWRIFPVLRFGKMIRALTYCLIFLPLLLQAQIRYPLPNGDYILEDKTVPHASFRFHEDHSFDFFYGDFHTSRQGKGTWVQNGQQILLSSRIKPPQDFELSRMDKGHPGKTIVRVTDRNDQLPKYVRCIIHTSDSIIERQCDERGYVTLPRTTVSEISLRSDLWPDRWCTYKIDDPEAGYFQFETQKTVRDIDLNGIILLFGAPDKIFCRHPLFPDKPCVFLLH